jgi:tetratricopeptide (TPR) repeat protein
MACTSDHGNASGGMTSHARSIEAELKLIPGVSDALVMTVANPHAADRLLAAVEIDSDQPPAETVVQQIAAALARHNGPLEIMPLRWFPRTPSGTIRRQAIKAAFIRQSAGPQLAHSLYLRAVAAQEIGRHDLAAASLDDAIAINPGPAPYHSALGNALRELGRPGEAIASYRKAIALAPDLIDAHYNIATTLLAEGDLQAGWTEFEWRWKTVYMAGSQRTFKQAQWTGEPARGQTLLIYAEQGFGDSLQFCRYATLAAKRGLRVILEVQAPLVRLLRTLPGVDQVMALGEPLPDFDVHCPMMSLPLAFATTVETIPGSAAYLRADPMQVAVWQTRLDGMPQRGPRIGLVWAGSAMLTADRRRSINPEKLAPLFRLSGFHFFSVQKSGQAAPSDFPLTDYMDEMDDFADTAALIANLDLVISVDTAVAHLAAALGKPVWLLDRFDHDWRWLTGRRDSPWYPTLRLYRQPQRGDWDAVLAEVLHDLDALPRGPRQTRPAARVRTVATVAPSDTLSRADAGAPDDPAPRHR